MTNIEFVRFNATDGVELRGWFSEGNGDRVVIHIHGMSGNGYENYFLDTLREMYTQNGISFFTIDTRGRGIISDFRQDDGWKHAGSCFEIFEESVYDIQGAIEYLQTIGKKRFVLQGHSLGCTKVVYYAVSQDVSNIEKIILLAPTDMTGWAQAESYHEEYLEKARALLEGNRGEELVGAQCWLDKTPLSAQTYLSLCVQGGSADIYGDREGGALLSQVSLPMLIVYGTEDIGIIQIDGTMEKWLERVNKIKHSKTDIAIINGASHGFRGYERQLAQSVQDFVM